MLREAGRDQPPNEMIKHNFALLGKQNNLNPFKPSNSKSEWPSYQGKKKREYRRKVDFKREFIFKLQSKSLQILPKRGYFLVEFQTKLYL